MSLSLIAGCIWVVVAAAVAALPFRHQFPPGILLLAVAPGLLGWIAHDHGWWIFSAGLFAFVSMFRRPLWHLIRVMRGEQPEASG